MDRRRIAAKLEPITTAQLVDLSLRSQELTVTLYSLKSSDDVLKMNDAWSKPVTQADVLVVPRNFVGVKDAKVGSYEPNSTANLSASQLFR